MPKVTPHFSSEEFDRPERTIKGKVYPAAKYPAEWIESRLRPLCAALEVIRAALGKPIHVNSGYRDRQFNVAIGGAPKSQHMEGKAADITADGVMAEQMHELVLKLYKEGKIKIGGLGFYPEGNFVHVDVRSGKRLTRWTGSRSGS